MDRFASFVIRHKKVIIAVFLAAAALCTALSALVGVNYNMADYLPPEAQSTTALAIMEKEFPGNLSNTSVMVKNVSVEQALSYKQQLARIPGITEVLWLDDTVDLKKPLEMADADSVESFYKDGNALYMLTIADGLEPETVSAIWELIGPENAVAGEAPDLAAMQQATGAETTNAIAILLPIIILILILSSGSWFEPLLFLMAIGVSILINMGTNFFFGEISFMTNSVSPILQLAVSLDYAIFLLHSFDSNRKKYANPGEAMRHAVKSSLSTVAASAATTLFGFLALTFMNFQIGADLGWVLAKGIILSFISTMVFLPAFTLCTFKLIDKTKHRPLLPSFGNIGKTVSRFAIPAIVIVAIAIVPCFLGQGQTAFLYGNSSASAGTAISRSKTDIKETFGQSTAMVVLVPRGDVAKEAALSDDLRQLNHVKSVISYANTVGKTLPSAFLSEDISGQFYSDNYARIIVYTDTEDEGDVAFSAVEEITQTAKSYYGDAVYSVGQSANLYDMKSVIQVDNQMVTWIAVIAIFLVLLVTFRSATLPFILLLTIETGIWINLAIPYFTGTSINFIGYLVLNTVQLGATVDYAILLTTTYTRHRRLLPAGQAVNRALGDTFKSILISAATLASAGFTLFATSTNPAVSDIGLLLGRGTLLSFAMVVCFLPALLKLFDRPIAKTTWHSGFFHDKQTKPRAKQ